jgi:hypothetical protein
MNPGSKQKFSGVVFLLIDLISSEVSLILIFQKEKRFRDFSYRCFFANLTFFGVYFNEHTDPFVGF